MIPIEQILCDCETSMATRGHKESANQRSSKHDGLVKGAHFSSNQMPETRHGHGHDKDTALPNQSHCASEKRANPNSRRHAHGNEPFTVIERTHTSTSGLVRIEYHS